MYVAFVLCDTFVFYAVLVFSDTFVFYAVFVLPVLSIPSFCMLPLFCQDLFKLWSAYPAVWFNTKQCLFPIISRLYLRTICPYLYTILPTWTRYGCYVGTARITEDLKLLWLSAMPVRKHSITLSTHSPLETDLTWSVYRYFFTVLRTKWKNVPT